MKSDRKAYVKTPIGLLEVHGSEMGISKVHFTNEHVNIRKPPKVLAECVFQIKQYFMGHRQCFDLALDLHGTPFQLRVWQELCKVPFGTTITYEKLAKKLGDAKAQRAVGGANGKNPVSLIIPCHRVIGKQGKLVGYAGGLDRKKWLLEFEHAFSQMDLFYE